ncbi:hypothetical protein ACQVP2_29590 [Methylobacterium aquaticum]|uniref:hypothetical protein n=1 Tax=Methylobacterium aquaticum TaxID=270351 RepID=UPI003D16DFFC
MNEYFKDRNGIFPIEKYVTLEYSIVKCAQYKFEVDIEDFIFQTSLSPELRDQNFQNDYARNERVFRGAWKILRGFLYDGVIKSISIDDDTGEKGEIPNRFWGSRFADFALQDGRVPYDETTREFCGKILIDESAIEFYFTDANKEGDIKFQNVLRYLRHNTGEIDIDQNYFSDGYVNICDAFDCLFEARQLYAKETGRLNGSIASQDKKIARIGDGVEKTILSALEDGTISAYHYDEGGTTRKIRQNDWAGNDDDSFYIKKNVRYAVITPRHEYTNGHDWQYKVSINVDQVPTEGKVLIGIEDLSSLLTNEEAGLLHRLCIFDGNSADKIALEDSIDLDDVTPSEKKRGRPPEFDKEMFMWEALKVLIFEVGPFPTAEALGLSASERYALVARGKKPSYTWTVPEIKKLMTKLDVEENLKKSKRNPSKADHALRKNTIE